MNIENPSMRATTSMSDVLWRSVTEAGFIAGIIATCAHLANMHGHWFVVVFFVLLLLLSVSIFNVRAFRLNRALAHGIDYVSGHDKSFEYLTSYMKRAKSSIWVTRFSRGGIEDEEDYFTWTIRRIVGNKTCRPVDVYRRVMRIDSRDKAILVADMLSKAGESRNFFLRKTNLYLPFEILLIDGEYGFILFHESEGVGNINSVMRIGRSEIVHKLQEMYQSIWKHEDTIVIKDAALTKDDIDRLVDEYRSLAVTLLV